MTIQLKIEPATPPMSWQEFCKVVDPYSIALDGFVVGATECQGDAPRANLNHHENVYRLSTRCTCAQVLIQIRMGLFELFRDDQGPRATVYVNDCDEDVCLSWFLLKHHYMAGNTMNPNLNRLVHMEDMLDTTAGAYPFPQDLPLLQELAWVFDPYRRFRNSGKMGRKDAAEYEGVIRDVEHRIMQHILGRGGSLQLDFRYRRVGGNSRWVMAHEIGAQARTALLSEGHKAYVAFREREDGAKDYTVGRVSNMIPFDLPHIFAALNDADGTTGQKDCWGGGDLVGGSPRVKGSHLSPDKVERIVESVLHPLVTIQLT